MLTDKDINAVYQFKEYLIANFYMSRSTADDVYIRFIDEHINKRIGEDNE